MADSDIRDAIAAERHDLATILAGLPADAWDAPSLCAGWRVHEVVAHMTMPFRYSRAKVILELLKARGDFNRMADRCARRDAAKVSAGDLAASIMDNVRHPWKPPGGGYGGALSHDVIHGLDITVALGLDRVIPEDRLRIVLDGMTPKSVTFFGADLDGVELRADDIDFTYGSGTPLHGAAQHLLLVVCGRALPAGLIRGEASDRYTRA